MTFQRHKKSVRPERLGVRKGGFEHVGSHAGGVDDVGRELGTLVGAGGRIILVLWPQILPIPDLDQLVFRAGYQETFIEA